MLAVFVPCAAVVVSLAVCAWIAAVVAHVRHVPHARRRALPRDVYCRDCGRFLTAGSCDHCELENLADMDTWSMFGSSHPCDVGYRISQSA